MKKFVFLLFLISLTYVSCEDTDLVEDCDDPNAEYTDCAICPGSCENRNPDCSGTCEPPGCYCKQGYIRKSESDPTCVPRSSCFSCKSYEEYNECGTACPKTCENYKFYNTIACITLCVEGCFCKDGLVRVSPNGPCVLPQKCIKCTKPNQVYSECGANGCQNTCRNPTFAQVCKGPCVAGCVCKEGYLKNSKGDCVLPKDCKECYGKNEVWTECDNNSCQKNCATYWRKDLACRPICNSGCICKKGYLRNSKGICVPISQCEKLCPEPNTEFTECVPCDNTCEIYATSGICNFLVCNPGCTCKPGFYLNSKGKCVPPKECDYCKENAVFSKCDNHPCRDTCSDPTFSTRCRYDNSKCYPGCICKEGYLKDTKGDCVPIEKCGKCKKPNQIFSKCDKHPCRDTCQNPFFSKACSFVPGCYPGCICKPGYLENANGDCVPAEQCLKCRLPNEIASRCDAHPCLNTCENPDRSNGCSYEPGCYTGCVCKSGFLRNKQGNCVPEDQCPPECTDPNSFYNSCGNDCALTCKNKDDPPVCVAACLPDRGGCECKQGYAYNDEGICIKVEECPPPLPPTTAIPKGQSCPEDEEYNPCGTNCPPTCENKDDLSLSCASAVCVPGCFCREGLVRNTNTGKCVSPEECPPPTCKDPNSEWYRCKPCVGTCDNPNIGCQVGCIPGCECKDGFVKKSDTDNTCVPLDQCPQKCKDPNSEYLSCKRCVGSCDERNPICDKSCNPPGCYCKVGYIKKSKTDSTCIKESACPTNPPKCGVNEIWSKNCPVFPETCNCEGKHKCETKPGCCCKSGYVREYKGGKCIHRDECEEHDEHED